MTPDWPKAAAQYVAAFAECSLPLTEPALRKATDALHELQRAHYATLSAMLGVDALKAELTALRRLARNGDGGAVARLLAVGEFGPVGR